MTSEKHQHSHETGHWLRVSTLALTALAPIISSIGTRLLTREKRIEVDSITKNKRPDTVYVAETYVPEKAQVAGNVFYDTIHGLKARTQPYGEELARQVGMVRERGGEAVQRVSEQGTRLGHDLAERGLLLKQEIAQRSRQSAQALQEKLAAQTTAQERQRQAEQRKRDFWIALGFGLGLAIAGIITFRLIRQRIQQRQEAEELDTHIQLLPPSNGTQHNGTLSSVQRRETELARRTAGSHNGTSKQPATTSAPTDAVYVGVVSSKRYYPIETPLDQIALSSTTVEDVVYFSSEDEARAQGFLAAK